MTRKNHAKSALRPAIPTIAPAAARRTALAAAMSASLAMAPTMTVTMTMATTMATTLIGTLSLTACESTDATGRPVAKRSSVTKQSVTKSAPKWETRPSPEQR
ncbi:MAG: hypothetical protein ACKOYN_13060 [Planctomycetota bacterium]